MFVGKYDMLDLENAGRVLLFIGAFCVLVRKLSEEENERRRRKGNGEQEVIFLI